MELETIFYCSDNFCNAFEKEAGKKQFLI